jgi:omega-6 fatty acid desaturase (delta-12 desaturase)
MAATPLRAEQDAVLPRADAAALARHRRNVRDVRSLPRGLFLFALHYGLYVVTLLGAVAPLPIAVNIVSAIANGVLIALLFIIGHDALHGAFVPEKRHNQWIGRLAFIPCAHSVSLWVTGHNKQHHRFTNFKGVDHIWEPMSKAEYDAASPARRLLERVYRSPFGPVVYYYGEYWVYRMMLPLAPELRRDWRQYLPDSLFVVATLLLTIAGVALAGHALVPTRPLWLVIALGWGLPFAVWNYMMAFTIYMNHTHADIPWFTDKAAWRAAQAELRCSTNVAMPLPIFPPLYAKVMAHTAHHVHPHVPAYGLPEAQAALDKVFGAEMPAYTLSLGDYLRTTRACKLFDFETGRWTDFKGNPTSPVMQRFYAAPSGEEAGYALGKSRVANPPG